MARGSLSLTRFFIAGGIGFAGLCFAVTAYAAEELPVLLSAQSMRFDDTGGIAIASGDVEITQGQRVLLADRVSYHSQNNTLSAEGNVALVEADGTVLFSDRVELSSDMAAGFAERVRILLPDNSRVTAPESERLNDHTTTLTSATYSPCNLCPEDPSRAPLWQLRANKVTHDRETKNVAYEDARLELAGVPVLYAPYFSHPDPTVFQRSGFLSPRIGSTDEIGFFTGTPYYFAIDPWQDATLTPTFSGEDVLMLQGQYRRRFAHGSLALEASGTRADRADEDGTIKQNPFRGHFSASTDFSLSPIWRTGANLALVTDKTYALRYDLPLPDVLENRVYVEGFKGRDYAALDAFHFQDTRPGSRPEEPVVLPRLQATAYGAPRRVLGGRWSLQGGLLTLHRSLEGDVRRLHVEPGWQRRDVWASGVVSSVSAQVPITGYDSAGVPDAAGSGEKRTGQALRLLPQTQARLSYPVVRNWQNGGQTLLSPELGLLFSPSQKIDPFIPNEDSQDFEFDATNLYAANRYPGLDVADSGSRVIYGLRGGHYGAGSARGEAFLGQSLQFLGDTNTAPRGSGIERAQSDVVGYALLQPANWLEAHYNFRLDSRDLTPRKHDAELSVGPDFFRPYSQYLFVQSPPDALTGITENQEQIIFGIFSNFAENWTVNLSRRLNISPVREPLNTLLVFDYTDECLNFRLSAARDETRRAGVNSGTSVVFQLVFRNLGGIDSGPVNFQPIAPPTTYPVVPTKLDSQEIAG